MSNSLKESPSVVFFNSVFLCMATWLFWTHYDTVNGPTALATITEKDRTKNKHGYNHQLVIEYTGADQQVATSRLDVSESDYDDFALGDTFPIRYAESSRESTVFVGEQFYNTFGAVIYAVLLLILVFFFKPALAEWSSPSPPKPPPTPKLPSHYAPLMWAILGVAAFGGGIISCRTAPNPPDISLENTTYQYQLATLLGTRYTPGTNRPWALVRLPETDGENLAQVDLTPNQHALLYARLTRVNPQNQQLEVAYLPNSPQQLVLADARLEPVSTAIADSPLGLSYNTLGMLLCGIGFVLVIICLPKYIDRLNE